MAFDRKRFQAAKLEVNKKVTEEVEKTFKTNSSRGDYHSIDEGKNYFRIMPPHDPDEPSMQPEVIYWLECKVPELKDGEPTGKFETKNRPIFDSRIHGGTPKDIINEYISFTKSKVFAEIQDKDLRIKKLAPINGWKDKSGKWNPGILPNQSFVCYATKGDILPQNIGRLRLWPKDKETLEKLNISEDADEPIYTDTFSDPDEGVQFVMTRGEEKGKAYTMITKNSFDPRGRKDIATAYEEWQKSQIVSDEVLMKLQDMEPLSKQFKNAYKRSDFERALEALQMFDVKHNYGTFEDNDFISIVEEIEKYYPEQDEVETEIESAVDLSLEDMTRAELKQYIKENKIPVTVVGSMSDAVIRDLISDYLYNEETQEDVEEEIGEVEGDEFSNMNREELKKHIKKVGLSIKVTKQMAEEDIRKAIRDTEVEEETEEEEEVFETEEETQPEEEISKKTESLKERLARLKKQ